MSELLPYISHWLIQLDQLYPAFLGGGIVERLFEAAADWFTSGLKSVIENLFSIQLTDFVTLEPPGTSAKAEAAWHDSFELAMAIFPVMIIMGMLSMPFAEEKKTSLWRQGLRMVGTIAIIAVSKSLIDFGVDLSNLMTKALLPESGEVMTAFAPNAGVLATGGSVAAFLGPVGPMGVIFVFGMILLYMFVAYGLVLVMLQLRVFLIFIVYIASPLLAVFWYADWGLMESVNEFANKWARMGVYTLLSGPILAIIFKTITVLSTGTLMANQADAGDTLAGFWSHIVLVTIMPIIMLAATWKIISWAGEPLGTGQIMSGATTAIMAAAGAGIGAAGASNVGSAVSEAGGKAAGKMGSGGGGASGASGSSGVGGVATGSGGGGGGPTPGQGKLADTMRSQGSDPVSAASESAPTVSASESGTNPRGGVEGEFPGGTGGSPGPDDTVTGAGPKESSGEPKGYIQGAKERLGGFKDRNKAAIDSAVSNYKDKAKSRINPTNIERKRAQMKRESAAAIGDSQTQFQDSIDMGAGDHGEINLAEAEASGALDDSVKATNFDTSEDPTAALTEDGSFSYRNSNDELIQGSVGAKNQAFRTEQEALMDEADAHEGRADSIDEKMREAGDRAKATRKNLNDKYGDVAPEATRAFTREAIRGTAGAHSPYLMQGSGNGTSTSAQAAPMTNEMEQEAETLSGGGVPESSVSAETAMEHKEMLSESGERFDLGMGQYGFEPGGGRTPDGVSQQGFLTNPETGDRVAPVEVGEDSDIALSSNESVRLGNVGMSTRDGDSAQSLPSEEGEYHTLSVDGSSREFGEDEARADDIIGNSEMIGETATLKNHTIRETPGEAEGFEGQYFAESPNGERIPINATDEESNEALASVVGKNADITGEVENQYGMTEDTHAEYEGPHDYNTLSIGMTSEATGGAEGPMGSESPSSGSGPASGAVNESEASSEPNADPSGASNGVVRLSESDSPAEDHLGASDLTSTSMDEASSMYDYPDNATVSIPDDALYEYHPESATHETQKSKGSFKLMNGDELSEDAPNQIGAIAFNGGVIKDSNGNVQTYENGEPKTMPEDGSWNFDSVPDGENPVIEGEDFNDVQARHFYDNGSNHAHADASEMAAEHGGESNAYAQIRPSKQTDMSGHSHTGEHASTSHSEPSGAGEKAEHDGDANTAAVGTAASSVSVPTETHTEPTSHDDTGSTESGVGGREGRESSHSQGSEWGVTDGSIDTGESETHQDLHEERVDAHGMGGSDIIGDATLSSSDGESSISLADDTREDVGTPVAEYGEGRLSDVEEGDGVEISNAKVHSPPEASNDVLRMDEETEVNHSDEHEGPVGVTPNDGGDGDPPEESDADNSLTSGSGVAATGTTSDSVTETDDWEEMATNWRDHYDEEASDPDALSYPSDGFTADSMRVETLDNGEDVYITDYDSLGDDASEATPERAQELKHQSLVGHEWTEAMGHEVPNVAFNEDTNEIIQQEAGGADVETWGIDEAPDEVLEKVDRDQYEETMAVQLLGGNIDTNTDNIHVDEEGELRVIDFDRSATTGVGQVEDAEELKINAGAAGRVGSSIGKVNDDFHTNKFQYEEELTHKTIDMASELQESGRTEEVLEGVKSVDEEHSGISEPRAPVIENNIDVLAGEEFEAEERGASDSDISNALDDIDLS